MRQNVIAALAVKAIFIVLAPLGLITLVMAVAADMGMSLLVTVNGLRLMARRRRSDMPAGEPLASIEGARDQRSDPRRIAPGSNSATHGSP